QLTNAIVWSEGGVFNAFHREFFWCVGQVRSGRVQDRVIIAATQAQGNFTGDGRTYPALDGFAQHQRLRVEPASLIHQAAQTVAVDVVVFDGVFVMDRVEQAFV